MARSIRFQYKGAIYHVMARGDGGKAVFETDDDRKAFLFQLGEVCGSHGWRIHAWVLMGNHFHLLLETPQPNLVTGMRRLLSTFSQGWNRARLRRGHVFQGRCKAVPVNGTDADSYYFRIVADYIHLNPSRARLAGGTCGPLTDYPWSSLQCYFKGKGPDWLIMDRVLEAFELARDGRGRRAYVSWLEARAANEKGEIDEEAMAAMRRGWYLGEDTFKDRLLKLLKKAIQGKEIGPNHTGEALREHGVAEAERLVRLGRKILDLPQGEVALAKLSKSDERKVILAALLRKRTSVSNNWIAEKLAMGHPGSVSRVLGTCKNCDRLSFNKEVLERAIDEKQ